MRLDYRRLGQLGGRHVLAGGSVDRVRWELPLVPWTRFPRPDRQSILGHQKSARGRATRVGKQPQVLLGYALLILTHQDHPAITAPTLIGFVPGVFGSASVRVAS